MHSEQTIKTLCALYDLGCWIDAMPEAPTDNGGAALMETYYNACDDAMGYEPTIQAAWDYATEQAGSYTEQELWEEVAAAMEVELTR